MKNIKIKQMDISKGQHLFVEIDCSHIDSDVDKERFFRDTCRMMNKQLSEFKIVFYEKGKVEISTTRMKKS